MNPFTKFTPVKNSNNTFETTNNEWKTIKHSEYQSTREEHFMYRLLTYCLAALLVVFMFKSCYNDDLSVRSESPTVVYSIDEGNTPKSKKNAVSDLKATSNKGQINEPPAKAAFVNRIKAAPVATTAPPAKRNFVKDPAVVKYIKAFKKTALTEERKYGIPAEIKMAQGILESDAGRSKLCKATNNHFGVKCFSTTCSKGHCKNFHDDDHKDFFKCYNGGWESWRAQSKLLQGKRYKSCFEQTTLEGWAKHLKKNGYATDKKYAEKLLKKIADYELEKIFSEQL